MSDTVWRKKAGNPTKTQWRRRGHSPLVQSVPVVVTVPTPPVVAPPVGTPPPVVVDPPPVVNNPQPAPAPLGVQPTDLGLLLETGSFVEEEDGDYILEEGNAPAVPPTTISTGTTTSTPPSSSGGTTTPPASGGTTPPTTTPTQRGMALLKYRSLDTMKWTKDMVTSQPSDTTIHNLVSTMSGNFNLTHIAIAQPMDETADYQAASVTLPSPRTAIAYTQKWADEIHNAGLGVLFRNTFNGIEGLYGFQQKVGVNRFPAGTAASAPTDGQTTWLGKLYAWITAHPTLFKDGDIWAPLPERTQGIFSDSTSFLSSSVPTLYRGVAISGLEFGTTGGMPTIPGTAGTTYTSSVQGTFNYYAGKGLNVIRLPFEWERLQPTLNGALDSAYLALIDSQVTYCANAGMKIILDCHNYCRYQTSQGHQYLLGASDGVLTAAHLADLWTKLAQHYVNNTTVLGYDIMNEPHDMPVGTTPQNYLNGSTWTAACQTAINAIRQVDSTHYIFAELDNWAGAQAFPYTYGTYNGADPTPWWTDPAGKLVYEVHYYFDPDHSGTYYSSFSQSAVDNITPDCTPIFQWAQRHGITLLAGEYGTPRNNTAWLPCLTAFLNLCDQYNVWATYWAGGDWYNFATGIQPASNDYTQETMQMPYVKAHLGSGTGGLSIQQVYAKFFNDVVAVSQAAFKAIGKNVVIGYTANNFSEVQSGWLMQSIFDTAKVVSIDHYGVTHTPTEIYNDDTNAKTAKGYPVFHQEWGDYWNNGMDPTARNTYLMSMYQQFAKMAQEGTLLGFNYWGFWDNTAEGLATTNTDGTFSPNSRGQLLAQYLSGQLT